MMRVRSISAPLPSLRRRPICRDFRTKRKSPCGSFTPAAWSKWRDHVVMSPTFAARPRAGAVARRADPLRCQDGRARHHAQRLPHNNAVICTLADPGVPPCAARSETPDRRQRWSFGGGSEGAVVAIGNAPTALFRLLDMLDQGAPRPAAIIGVPVGFVGAAESRKRSRHDPHRPFLIVRGRMGGSAMAVAAVNALARAWTLSTQAALVGIGVGPGDAELSDAEGCARSHRSTYRVFCQTRPARQCARHCRSLCPECTAANCSIP